jgi:probable rRNA maturation factor
MSAALNIDLVNRQRSYRFDRKQMLHVARAVLRAEGVRACDLEIAVVGDAEIAVLNQRYLSHRGPTDVLSFDLSDEPAAGRGEAAVGRTRRARRRSFDRGLMGQVIVSADTARRSAARLGHSIWAELALYVIHGLLHLLDYDDLAEPARTRMHARQRQLAMRLGLRLRG